MGGSALGSSGDNGTDCCVGEREEEGWSDAVGG